MAAGSVAVMEEVDTADESQQCAVSECSIAQAVADGQGERSVR